MKVEVLKKFFEKQLAASKAHESIVRTRPSANDSEFEKVPAGDRLLFFFKRDPRAKTANLEVIRVLESELSKLAEKVKSGDYPAEHSLYPYLTLS